MVYGSGGGGGRGLDRDSRMERIMRNFTIFTFTGCYWVMRWAPYLVYIGRITNAYKTFLSDSKKAERKGPFDKPSLRWKGNIKMKH
jgi:hypothetical protein